MGRHLSIGHFSESSLGASLSFPAILVFLKEVFSLLLKELEGRSVAPMMEFPPRCSKAGVQLSCAQHQESVAFLFSRGEVAFSY